MKNNFFFFIYLSFILISCSEDIETATVAPSKDLKKTDFEMYEVSEMTALMERLYANNQVIKRKIEAGETNFGDLPEDYIRIHSAVLTDPTDRDEFLERQAESFLEAQSLVYSDPTNAKANFNLMVNSCIECHKVKCSGPIERKSK